MYLIGNTKIGDKMKKIIIIGSGITGLCTGIFLLKKGHEVTIYEKNDFAGGCCTGWERNGYYIDNCMHWLTGTNQHTKTFKLWKQVGALSETSNLYQGDYFYKSMYNNEEIALSYDLDKTRTDMLNLSISDEKEINNFINTTLNFVRMHKEMNFIENTFKRPLYYINSYFKYRHLSLEDLSKRFKHPLLKKLFTDFLPKEYCSLALIYAYATFASGDGKVYSKGSKAFANNILKTYLDKGGFIHFNSEVTNININNNRVESIIVNNKETVTGDEFIFTASPTHLFSNLISEDYMPKVLKDKFSKRTINPIYSSFHVAFKIKKKHNQISDSMIFEIPPIKIGATYITRLMLKDYTYLYPNKADTVVQVFTIQSEEDYNYWQNLKNNNHEAYEEEKKNIADKLMELICNEFKSMKQSISLLDVWTPYTYTEYFNSYIGSYMGFTFTKKSNLKDIPYKINGLKNFYSLTYWQKICGGLPIGLELGNHISKVIK